MTVYVVEKWWPYEGGSIEAAFSEKAFADAYVEANRPDCGAGWTVHKIELDAECSDTSGGEPK